jgi:hypothetical protein
LILRQLALLVWLYSLIYNKNPIYFASTIGETGVYLLPLQSVQGDVAQSVEQRTENPCVGGSIPSITTSPGILDIGVLCY